MASQAIQRPQQRFNEAQVYDSGEIRRTGIRQSSLRDERLHNETPSQFRAVYPMRLVIVKRLECPPDGYRFTHPETGHKSFSLDKRSWLQAIYKYRADNGFPQVDPADCIDQLCKLLPPGWCAYESGEKPSWYINTRLGVRDVMRGTKAMAQFIIAGAPLVSKEKAAERALVCSRCYFNVPISGCSPCVGLSSAILAISGANKTPSDASLRSCAVCACSTKAKVWMPTEIIAKSTTEEQMQRFPDFCWQRQELSGIDSVPQSV